MKLFTLIQHDTVDILNIVRQFCSRIQFQTTLSLIFLMIITFADLVETSLSFKRLKACAANPQDFDKYNLHLKESITD